MVSLYCVRICLNGVLFSTFKQVSIKIILKGNKEMKKWMRILCLVLIMAFVLPMLVACGDDDKDSGKNDKDDKNESPIKVSDNITGNTYGGDEFTIYSVEDMFEKKYFFADKSTGDGMNDSLYQRQQNVENTLEIKLIYKGAEGVGEEAAYQVYHKEVQNAIKAGDEKYQLVLSHAYYALPTLITGGSLKDFKQLESIDVTEDYWNKKIMDEVAYNGRYYLGYSDFNLAATYVIAFNQTLFDNFASNFEGETMYDFVNNGKWTLKKMEEIVPNVYEGDGKVGSTIFGLTGELWVPFCGFIQSSGESIVTRNTNTGKYSISWNDNKTVRTKINAITTVLTRLYQSEEVYFWKIAALNGNNEPEKVALSSGRAFMQVMKTNELIGLKSTNVKFGVIPYPMYDEDQFNSIKYRSLNWAGYLCVPANIGDVNMVGDVIESLSFFSEEVTTYYYEKLLGRKVSETPEDAEMLELIWDSLCSDFGVTYSMIDSNNHIDALVYAIPQCLNFGTQFTAHSATHLSAAQNALKTNINDKLGK